MIDDSSLNALPQLFRTEWIGKKPNMSCHGGNIHDRVDLGDSKVFSPKASEYF